MPNILSLHSRQIFDSRGTPTVEVDCALDDGSFGRASVPSGVSAGVHEALELRDGDKSLYGGKSVLKAVANVNTVIQKKLKGQSVADHRTIDQMMLDLDGTPNKAKLGANAILGVSMAICRARAQSEKLPLFQSLASQYEQQKPSKMPVPMMVFIEGGAHSDAGLSFQEFMIVPDGFESFSEAMRAAAETFQALKKNLKAAHQVISVGDEGAFAPHVKDAREAFKFLTEAIKSAGYEGRIRLALDAAASEIHGDDGKYAVDGASLTSPELVAYFEKLSGEFPILSIEDSHAEDDWEGFAMMMQKLGKKLQLVGDDLLVTNTKRILEAKDKKAVNAVLIKVNQIGSVSETVDAIELTRKQGWNPVVSHRGGDTDDTFIAHLAVGLGTGQIKTGGLSRAERVSKYNELLRIEEELGKSAQYQSPFRSA